MTHLGAAPGPLPRRQLREGEQQQQQEAMHLGDAPGPLPRQQLCESEEQECEQQVRHLGVARAPLARRPWRGPRKCPHHRAHHLSDVELEALGGCDHHQL